MSEMDDKLVETVEQRLAETFGPDDGDDDNLELEAEPTADPVEPAEEPTPEPEKEPAEEPAAEPEPTPENENPEPEPEQPTSGLPDSFYRAAVHQEWTPEEIEAFYKSDPDKATKTFKRMYDSTNKLTAEFARIGRMKPEEPAVSVPAAKDASTARLDVLKEQYGADDPLVQTIEALQGQLESMSSKATPAPEAPQNSSEDAALQQTVNGFFAADDMKLFKDFYGTAKEGAVLPQEQFNNRMATLELADSILTGATRLGRKMDVTEAMSLAHLTVSEPVREKAIRADLKSRIVKRGKSVSLEPTSEKPTTPVGPVTGQELEAKVASKMASIFKS